MRLALAGSTPSADAVLNSLLALSSLHRFGVQTQAFRLKIATIKALASATTCNLTAREIIQHAAAGMLLCSFEVTPSLFFAKACAQSRKTGPPSVMYVQPMDLVHFWGQTSFECPLSEELLPGHRLERLDGLGLLSRRYVAVYTPTLAW